MWTRTLSGTHDPTLGPYRSRLLYITIKSWTLSGNPQRYTETPWPSAELCTVPFLTLPFQVSHILIGRKVSEFSEEAPCSLWMQSIFIIISVAQSIQTLLWTTRLNDYQPIYHLYNIVTARGRDSIPTLWEIHKLIKQKLLFHCYFKRSRHLFPDSQKKRCCLLQKMHVTPNLVVLQRYHSARIFTLNFRVQCSYAYCSYIALIDHMLKLLAYSCMTNSFPTEIKQSCGSVEAL